MSPECAQLIQRMLTVDPEARITLPEIAKHPWLQAQAAQRAAQQALLTHAAQLQAHMAQWQQQQQQQGSAPMLPSEAAEGLEDSTASMWGDEDTMELALADEPSVESPTTESFEFTPPGQQPKATPPTPRVFHLTATPAGWPSLPPGTPVAHMRMLAPATPAVPVLVEAVPAEAARGARGGSAFRRFFSFGSRRSSEQ